MITKHKTERLNERKAKCDCRMPRRKTAALAPNKKVVVMILLTIYIERYTNSLILFSVVHMTKIVMWKFKRDRARKTNSAFRRSEVVKVGTKRSNNVTITRRLQNTITGIGQSQVGIITARPIWHVLLRLWAQRRPVRDRSSCKKETRLGSGEHLLALSPSHLHRSIIIISKQMSPTLRAARNSTLFIIRPRRTYKYKSVYNLPIYAYRSSSVVLCVGNERVLWKNGWFDQYAVWGGASGDALNGVQQILLREGEIFWRNGAAQCNV